MAGAKPSRRSSANHYGAATAGAPPAAPLPPAMPAPPRPVQAFALAGLALLVLSLTVFKMSNNDIWIHLKTGEIILDTWSVPEKDPYSFTASDHDYVAHEWLSGVLFYVVYAAGGVNGLIFFKAAVIGATCLFLWLAARRYGAEPLLAFACFGLMLFIGSARFLERPHIFSYLFTALYLLCHASWRAAPPGEGRRWLYLLPALHVLWVNLHGGHYQGIFLLVMLGLAEVVMRLRADRLGLAADLARSGRDVALLAISPFACLAAGLLNPYGWRLLTFPFELTGQEIFMKGIYEWQPALFPSYNVSSMFLYYIVWISLLFGTFLFTSGHRELQGAPRLMAWGGNGLLVALWAMFVYELASAYRTPMAAMPTLLQRHAPFWYVAVALFLVFNLHRLRFHHAGVTALFFAMSMRHNRAVTDAAVATLPALACGLTESLGRGELLRRLKPLRSPLAWIAAGAVMAALGIYTFNSSYAFSFSPLARRDMGFGIADNMPVGAVDYIERNGITGRAFPSYNAAALLINRMWPEVKVAMDSRNDVYGEALYREYTRALAGGEDLEAYIHRWGIDFFLLTYGNDRNPAFFRVLDSSPDWAMVYFDDRACVYVRRSERFRAIVERDAFTLIRPGSAAPAEIGASDAGAWLAEADRAIRNAPPGAWNPLQYRFKALLAMGRVADAEAALADYVKHSPDLFYAWQQLGEVHMQMGRPDLAEPEFRRCLELQPDYPPCAQALIRMRPRR